MAVRHDRLHAERDDGFVVFHLGMRINRFRAVHRWLPVFLSAPRMVEEQDEPTGLLGSEFLVAELREFRIVQYWESFEALRAYAREGGEHSTMWARFNDAYDDGSVGIWHETYLVRDGEYETVYRDMPETGLGAASGSDLVPATGDRESAAGRLDEPDESDESGSTAADPPTLRSDDGGTPTATDGGVPR